ncbi:MAG: hypothetical protein E7353_04665 [Clostridiales bacterium]|nr:hypothetical protein [Clostridiales bacterium]
MIEFENVLPRFRNGEKFCGQYNNPEMVLPCHLSINDYKLGEFLHRLHNTVADDRRLLFIQGKVIPCCHNWIRDHVHMMKAFMHYEYRLKDFLDYIISTQREQGYYLELVKQITDAHHTFVGEEHRTIYEEDSVAATRLELEADVEYLVVEGVMLYYKATGDFEWVKKVLPSLEKAINYMTSDPKRWNKELGLVIRPFTIDTWDFVGTRPSTNRRIIDGEQMSAMHGDNSGVYDAMKILEFFNAKNGDDNKAKEWSERAETLRKNAIRYLFNGKFFIHQYHINHSGNDNKESERLSISNAYDINRNFTTTEQSRSIINEYMERRKNTKAFAEWFTIDPPYEKFGKLSAGQYVNGGITPFVAGEIALAAFNNGYEEYGWDIITRCAEMMERDGCLKFVYSPDYKESNSTQGPGGWGCAGLINAIDKGLAGINDVDCLYREIDFSPRFTVTHYTEMRYITGYEISDRYVDVRFIIKDYGMRYDLISQAEKINAHILLPKDKDCKKLLVNGKEHSFSVSVIGESKYVDFNVVSCSKLSIEIEFERK